MPLVLFNPYIGPLSGATIPVQSGPGSDGNEGVLRIPQSSSIDGAAPSVCLVSYLGHSLAGGVFYSSSRLGKADTSFYAYKSGLCVCVCVCVVGLPYISFWTEKLNAYFCLFDKLTDLENILSLIDRLFEFKSHSKWYSY